MANSRVRITNTLVDWIRNHFANIAYIYLVFVAFVLLILSLKNKNIEIASLALVPLLFISMLKFSGKSDN